MLCAKQQKQFSAVLSVRTDADPRDQQFPRVTRESVGERNSLAADTTVSQHDIYVGGNVFLSGAGTSEIRKVIPAP
jgi:hypothetical protein